MNNINTIPVACDVKANTTPTCVCGAPLTGIAANKGFNAALEAVEDAFADQIKFSNAVPGTAEDALLMEADARHNTAVTALYDVVSDLLASVAAR